MTTNSLLILLFLLRLSDCQVCFDFLRGSAIVNALGVAITAGGTQHTTVSTGNPCVEAVRIGIVVSPTDVAIRICNDVFRHFNRAIDVAVFT